MTPKNGKTLKESEANEYLLERDLVVKVFV